MSGGDEHLPPPLKTSLAVVREWLDKITAPSTNPDLDLRTSGGRSLNALIRMAGQGRPWEVT